MNKLLAFFAAFFLNVTLATATLAANPPALTDPAKLISGDQTLHVGDIGNLPAFNYKEGSVNKGINPETFQELAKRAGIKKFNFIEFPVHEKFRIQALKEGKVDVILTMWDDPAFHKEFLATIPIYIRGGIGTLYAKEGKPFKNVDDLKGHKIGVIAGSYSQLHWLPKQHISSSLIKVYPTNVEVMAALKRKDIDVFVSYLALLRYNQNQNKGQFETSLIEPVKLVFFVRKQDKALQQMLNKALDSMWADGTLYAIKKKHLGPLGVEPARSYKQ
jgi:ABC-type amino acid transport substrate-binding protein